MYATKKVDEDEKLRNRAKKIWDNLYNQAVAI
jgi:hypothetical protein